MPFGKTAKILFTSYSYLYNKNLCIENTVIKKMLVTFGDA